MDDMIRNMSSTLSSGIILVVVGSWALLLAADVWIVLKLLKYKKSFKAAA